MDMTALNQCGQATIAFWLAGLTTISLLTLALIALLAAAAGILKQKS